MFQCFVIIFILLNGSIAKNIPTSHVEPPKNAKFGFALSLTEQQEIGIISSNKRKTTTSRLIMNKIVECIE